MEHVISQRSKEGFDPILSWEESWNSPGSLYDWTTDRPRKPEEQGYPTSHWLRRSILQKWDILEAYDVFRSLANEAGKLLVNIAPKIPELKGLCVEDEAEYWVLALRRLNLRPKWTTIIPSGKTILNVNKPECRKAQPGESFVSIMDSVFLQSALTCSEMLKLPEKSAEAKQRIESQEEDGQGNSGGNISGMPWKEARTKAEALVDEKGYLGHKKLYEAIGCSDNTLRRAINNSSKLQEAKEQYKSLSKTLKAVGLTAKVVKTYEDTSGPKLSDTEVDEILVEMLERIKREQPKIFEQTKEQLDEMNPDGKRRFAAVYKRDYQNKDKSLSKDGPKTQRQYKQV